MTGRNEPYKQADVRIHRGIHYIVTQQRTNSNSQEPYCTVVEPHSFTHRFHRSFYNRNLILDLNLLELCKLNLVRLIFNIHMI